MDPLSLIAGLGLGGLKHFLIDKPAAEKERKYEATTARWSPWTHMQSHYVADPNLFGSLLQGGGAGLQFGQGMQSADAANDMQSSYLDVLKAQAGLPVAPRKKRDGTFELGNGPYAIQGE